MKKGVRMMSLLLMLLLVFGSATMAQDSAPVVFCGQLTATDCDLLQVSQTAMTGLESGSSEFDLSMSISNIPDMPMDELEFHITGKGTFAIDPALIETMQAMQTDPTALFSDPNGLEQWMADLVKGISGDLNFTLAIPPELAALAGSEQPLPETLSISLRMVDGFGYVNLDDIATAMPDADVPPGWIGLDLATLMERAMQQGDFSDAMTMDPTAFQNYMTGLQDPTMLGDFVTVKRAADTDVMGQTAAVFRMTFDYGAFFDSEMFQELMSAQMEAATAMTGEELSESDMAEMNAVMGQMGPMFEGINLEIVQVIGLEDHFNHIIEMHMDWDLAGFMMLVDPTSNEPAPNFVFDMTIHNSDFNSAPAISAPEDATIFPISMILPSTDM